MNEVMNDLIKDVAAGGAIRHLHDLGYSEEEIQQRLDFPMDIPDIEAVIERHEERKAADDGGYRIIKEQGKYGKVTYRRVPIEPKEGGTSE